MPVETNDNPDTKNHLQLGEFCCALNFKDVGPEFQASVKNYFENFMTSREPDIRIDIEIILDRDKVSPPQSLCTSKTVTENRFDYHSGLIQGCLDLERKACFLQVKNVFFGNSSVRVFEQFFHQLYFSLLENKYGAGRYEKILVHSCGVLKNGCGYIFTGPSGSGKSTVAQLSKNHAVLNDEMCFVNNSGSRYRVQSTPFNGYFCNKINSSGPLTAIFLLKQDTRNFIKTIKFSDAVVAVAREIVPMIGVLDNVNKKCSVTAMIDTAAKVLSAVPFYELHFIPDKSLWDCIDAWEQKN